MSELLDLPIYSQLLAALLSCYFLLKKQTSFLKLLTLFLVVTVLVEIIGVYLSKIGKVNSFVYQYYTVFEYVTIFFLYKKLIKDKKHLMFSCLLLVGVFVFWCWSFFDRKYFFYAVVIGSFNVGILVFLYLRELLLSNNVIDYKNLLPFWVSVGLVVFYLPSIPFFSFWSFMKNKDLFPILHSLIVLMNVIISFGLIWSSKKE